MTTPTLALAAEEISCYLQAMKQTGSGTASVQRAQLSRWGAAIAQSHSDLERKDALLRQALEALENHNGNYKLTDAEADVVIAVQDAITKELQ